ncbi:MAG TPA: PAS domain S-box protein, partial [Nitrospirae bacterium]|nr:PAS domain S-box protein [Nitrospirota bacterium]
MEERRRIEEELKRSEERYRSIIETDPECVLILAPDGKLLEMNPAGLAMIEADSFEQVAGRPVYPLIAPQHRDAFRELVERVCSGDTGVLEFEMIGLKGTLRWLEIHAVPLRDGGERITGLLAVTRDITDRKRTEKELSQEKAFTDAVINSLPGIFYVYEEGQRLIKWNRTLETRTGYSPDELLNKHALDWFAEEERERIATEINNVMGKGESTVEANLVLKDGARVPYVLTGTRLRSEGRNYLIGIGIETTKLRQVEEELRKAEQEWSNTFDSISDFVSVHDREFRIVKANKALVDFLGIALEELIGRRCYEVFHGTDRPLLNCPYIESMRLKKTVTAEVEYTKLGIPLLVTSSPLFNGDGDLIGDVHFAKDVSG